jgi:parvulin-like peptidyl-prolyl isomerase
MARIKASCILVETQALASTLIDRLVYGADFSAVAMANSTHSSGPYGGNLGIIDRGQMERAFDNVAFSLSIGQFTTAPIKGEAGWYIIQRTG